MRNIKLSSTKGCVPVGTVVQSTSWLLLANKVKPQDLHVGTKMPETANVCMYAPGMTSTHHSVVLGFSFP